MAYCGISRRRVALGARVFSTSLRAPQLEHSKVVGNADRA